MSDTGQRIKKLRKKLNITADELALELNVSRSTIFRYESGDIEKVPAAIIEPLALALHTTPAYLMGWDEDPIDYDSVDNKDAPREPLTIAAHKRIDDDGLTDDQIEEVNRYIQYLKAKERL